MRRVGTLTRTALTESINRRVGITQADSQRMVERIVHHMAQALVDGEHVKVRGFGTFVLRDKTERIGRNPKTGTEAPIPPRRVVTFRPSWMLTDRINAGK
jgi:integration host factor subunit alpha